MSTLLLLVLLASPSQIEIHYMDPGAPLKLVSGEEVRCYTFTEYKNLLQMDTNLWQAVKDVTDLKAAVDKQDKIIVAKDVIISTLKKDKDVLQGDLDRTTVLWKDAEKKVIANAGGPIWPYFVAAGGAILGIVGATLAITSTLQKKP